MYLSAVFIGGPYLDQWIREDVYFWNEQYLLEILMTMNEKYEIIAALNYLKHARFNKLKEICPYLDSKREPASFYFRVK